MPTTLGKTKEQTEAARRRARQSIREYELIWLLQQRLRAVSWPHWRLRCMQPLYGHGMGVVSAETLANLVSVMLNFKFNISICPLQNFNHGGGAQVDH